MAFIRSRRLYKSPRLACTLQCEAMTFTVSSVYRTPIGPLKLVANPKGICEVKWMFGKRYREQTSTVPDRPRESRIPRRTDEPRSTSERPGTGADSKEIVLTSLKGSVPEDSPEHKRALEHLRVCVNWLDAYFGGTLLLSDQTIPKPQLALPEGGAFFHRVWTTLASTGIGERLSYAELARLTGNPRAARAVGQAVKKHSLPILVPCHRVVRSQGRGGGGDVGNYSGGEGTATKEWLLKHEGEMVQATLQASCTKK